MTKFRVHENFLDTEFFENIKNTITDLNFPWRRRDSMTSGILSSDPIVKNAFSSINDVNDSLFFFILFITKWRFYQTYINLI